MKSFLSYLGGKSALAGKILPLIPAHKCYVEVFAGAAWLLFRKEESQVEILNDINSDLITLYRVIQHHLEEFVRYFKWVLVSRDEFSRLLSVPPATLTDIQRSARFYYLLRTSYGAKLVHQSFDIGPSRRPRLNLLRIEEDLSAAHLRLSRVYIEHLSFQNLIPRFDRPDTFFYLDPPYFQHESDYGKGIFARDDFPRLASLLSSISGKFILSINDIPEMRQLFGSFHIVEVPVTYTINNEERKKVVELLILNY